MVYDISVSAYTPTCWENPEYIRYMIVSAPTQVFTQLTDIRNLSFSSLIQLFFIFLNHISSQTKINYFYFR